MLQGITCQAAAGKKSSNWAQQAKSLVHKDTFTCIENVDVDLPQGLIVLSRAVPTKGIDLVPDSHGRVVHPPWPTFQVHCPP